MMQTRVVIAVLILAQVAVWVLPVLVEAGSVADGYLGSVADGKAGSAAGESSPLLSDEEGDAGRTC